MFKDPQKKKKKTHAERRGWIGMVFIAPGTIVFFIFMIYPIINTFIMSVQNFKVIDDPKFVGFFYYFRLFTDEFFLRAIFNTVMIWLRAFIFQMTFGLIIAKILTDYSIKFDKGFQVLYFLPFTAMAVTFPWLLNFILSGPISAVNGLLADLGVKLVDFYDPAALASIFSYLLFWQNLGFAALFFVTGMKGISKEVIEASIIDGTTGSQRFFLITLPLLKPTILYVSVMSLITGLQNFDIPKSFGLFFGGLPPEADTMMTYMYSRGFVNLAGQGYAAATGVVLSILTLILSIFVVRMIVRTNKE